MSTGYLQDDRMQTGPMIGQAILRFGEDYYSQKATLLFDQHRIIPHSVKTGSAGTGTAIRSGIRISSASMKW